MARLVRQPLTESVLLGLLGSAAGLTVAILGVRILVALAPPGRMPRLDAIRLDLWVGAFTLGVSLLAGIGFGPVSAFHSSTRTPREALGTGAQRATERHGVLRASFAAAQVALAVV